MIDVTLELDVLQAVGRALARLDDLDAQRRVICWINDRFQQGAAPIQPSTDKQMSSARRGTGAPGADTLLGVEELSDFFERPGATQTMHREAEAESNQGVDSLVRSFVTDFQRLALEWKGA